jgi:capsular polysaccharide biosynthesis protein
MRGRIDGYFGIFLRWLWLLGLCTVIGAVGTFIVTKAQQPVYQATTVLLVQQENAASSVASSQITTTYAQMINQPIVLSRAASQAGGISPSELAKHVQAVAESDTALIDLSVDDTNPNRAAVLANTVALAFISVLNEQGIADQYPAVVFQPAVPPTTPDHPNPFQNGLAGGTLGFAIAAVLIHLLSLLDNPVHSARKAAELPDLAINDKPKMEQLTGSVIRDVREPAGDHKRN